MAQLADRAARPDPAAAARAGTDGLSAAALSRAIYGDAEHVVTVRAEVSRLRRVLGGVVETRPYRIAPEVDLTVVAASLVTARPDRPPGCAEPSCRATQRPAGVAALQPRGDGSGPVAVPHVHADLGAARRGLEDVDAAHLRADRALPFGERPWCVPGSAPAGRGPGRPGRWSTAAAGPPAGRRRAPRRWPARTSRPTHAPRAARRGLSPMRTTRRSGTRGLRREQAHRSSARVPWTVSTGTVSRALPPGGPSRVTVARPGRRCRPVVGPGSRVRVGERVLERTGGHGASFRVRGKRSRHLEARCRLGWIGPGRGRPRRGWRRRSRCQAEASITGVGGVLGPSSRDAMRPQRVAGSRPRRAGRVRVAAVAQRRRCRGGGREVAAGGPVGQREAGQPRAWRWVRERGPGQPRGEGDAQGGGDEPPRKAGGGGASRTRPSAATRRLRGAAGGRRTPSG